MEGSLQSCTSSFSDHIGSSVSTTRVESTVVTMKRHVENVGVVPEGFLGTITWQNVNEIESDPDFPLEHWRTKNTMVDIPNNHEKRVSTQNCKALDLKKNPSPIKNQNLLNLNLTTPSSPITRCPSLLAISRPPSPTRMIDTRQHISRGNRLSSVIDGRQPFRCHGGVVEETESHRFFWFGVMTWRTVFR